MVRLLLSAIVMLSLVFPQAAEAQRRKRSPPVAAPAPMQPSPPLECNETLKETFRPDELTLVILAHPFAKGETLALPGDANPRAPQAPADLCLVKLVVGPGNPGLDGAPSTSPGIGIEVWLPAREVWNERIHNTSGLGGFDGGEHASVDKVGWFYPALTAGNEGAVSASTDSGHRLTDGSWGMNPDGTLASQLWDDFAHRAQHEMALKVKALTRAWYGRPARFAYYEGASTGGRHGYRLAQQYPGDYDGIIGNLPAISWNGWVMSAAYSRLVDERDLGGKPLSEGQMDLASNAAIRACEKVGNVRLGYITDNFACRYDPATDPAVLCKANGGTNQTGDCLSKAQATAINKKWYGITSDGSVPSPATDNGANARLEGNHRWFGFPRGTSLYNVYYSKLDPVYSKMLAEANRSGSGREPDWLALVMQNSALAGPSFKNASGNGQAQWRGMSYAQLNEAFDRGEARNAEFGDLSSDNPDLSALEASGTKFLSWHGWNDEAIPVQGSIRYYDRVIAKMGGRGRVQNFFRLFLVPGAGHLSLQGTSNPDANPPVVPPGLFYKMMTDWVEKGIVPDRQDISSAQAKPDPISQPICPYPKQAKYVFGNPRLAASYICL